MITWFQWLFLVPLKGGRWHIIPQLAVYTTYIPFIYHLEPETTIDGSPENHPIEKENHLNQTSSNLHDFGFHVNFQRSIKKIPGYVTRASGWK